MFTTKIREKANRTAKPLQLLSIISIAALALTLGAATPQVWADDVVYFDEAQVFFEFNSTDLDLGFDIFVDGEPWESVRVIGPDGRIFRLLTDGSLNVLGQTEAVTESAEPGFCDEYEEDACPEDDDDFIQGKIDDFQVHFPEGWYLFRGTTTEGDIMRGRARLSHDLPDPPEIIAPEEEEELSNPFVIKWAPGDLGGPVVREYEVVAEMVINGRTFKHVVTVPGWARRITVSPQFIGMAARAEDAGTLEEFKVEIVGQAANRNKTITEFVLVEED